MASHSSPNSNTFQQLTLNTQHSHNVDPNPEDCLAAYLFPRLSCNFPVSERSRCHNLWKHVVGLGLKVVAKVAVTGW